MKYLKRTTFLLVIFITLIACSGKKKKVYETSFLFPLEKVNEGFLKRSISYGYIDANGNEIIPCKYLKAYPFSEGLGCVCEYDNKWGLKYGYIDSTGNYAITPGYQDARPFHNGRALVSVDGKNYGFIDKKGNVITPFIFGSRTSDFYNGTSYGYEFNRMVPASFFEQLVVKLFTLGYGNSDEPMYNVYTLNMEGKKELLDSNAFGTTYADTINWHRQNHLMRYEGLNDLYGYKKVSLAEFMRNKKYATADTIGTKAIRCDYVTAEDFVWGYARVSFSDGKVGYIDTTGKVIVKFAR